jgi:ParB family chromosome partitioning protein
MQKELKSIEIDQIIINPRIREDLGDIEELARSIKELGLMCPILINNNNVLLAGRRRIEACKQLGYTHIEALVMDIEGEVDIFNIESQENLCRKELTTAELDKEIEMKKTYAWKRVKQKSVVSRVWGKIRRFFRRKKP